MLVLSPTSSILIGCGFELTIPESMAWGLTGQLVIPVLLVITPTKAQKSYPDQHSICQLTTYQPFAVKNRSIILVFFMVIDGDFMVIDGGFHGDQW